MCSVSSMVVGGGEGRDWAERHTSPASATQQGENRNGIGGTQPAPLAGNTVGRESGTGTHSWQSTQLHRNERRDLNRKFRGGEKSLDFFKKQDVYKD